LRSFDQCRELLGRVNLDAVDHAALQALLVVDEDQRIEARVVNKALERPAPASPAR